LVVAGVLLTLGSVDQAALAQPATQDAVAADKPVSGGPPRITDPVPAGFASWDEVWAVQEDLDATADRITAAAATQDVAGGLGSIQADTRAREVRVYWKGQVPAPVQDVVDDSSTAVRVLPATYTADELQTAAHEILGEQPASEGAATPLVLSVGPRGDASGLEVTVAGSAAEARERPFLRDAEVDVTVEAGDLPTPASRDNDSAPYWAGGRWSTTTGGCSTGFAINHGSQEALMTAAHCANNGQTAFDGGGFSDVMGFVQNRQMPGVKQSGVFSDWWLGMDIEEINTSSAPRMFTGGPTSNTTDSVVGAQNNYEGTFVCASGSLSGLRCGVVVEDVGLTMYIKDNTDGRSIYSPHMVRAVQQNLKAAAGNGDSGGPIVAFASSFPDRAWARGIFSLFDSSGSKPCSGVPTGPGRTCSDEIWFVDFNSATIGGAQLQTTFP
jgi:hypothetical protein